MARCKGKTKKGTKCQRTALKGFDYCAIHKRQGLRQGSRKEAPRVTHVLLVDDDSATVDTLKMIIESAGAYEVEVVSDGDVGEELITAREWGFAIVELVLSGKDGVEVIRAGRSKHFDLPIMFVSASSNPSLIEAAFRAGANHHLERPIDPQEVLTQILGFTSAVDLDSPPTVVAVGARPGDLEMGCGGILCKHRAEGHRIAIVNLAGGGDPHSGVAESGRLAAQLLDARMINFGDESHRIADVDAAMATLKGVFEAASPGMLYVPTLSSDRPSSIQIHKIAMRLADDVPNVLAYQDPGSTVDFRPRLFIDLAPQMAHKLELVCYRNSIPKARSPAVGSE